VSSVTLPSLEEIAAATPTPKIFQLYATGDAQWTRDILTRVKDSGYAALALTVDVAHYSRRERPMLSGFQPPTRRRLTADRNYLPELTWDTLDRIKEFAGLPFMLKLSADGLAGIVRMLEILEDELLSAMGLVGLTSIADVTPRYVCTADAVTPPHEMSSWVNMPVGRIL
jgi:isopentenyl diphosphate isomerase/L-lactate dehydrogenase-like FMN-dependent dehydrogenase